jgi:hypothetical protein
MAIVRESHARTTGTGSTLTLTRPTGVASGDILIATLLASTAGGHSLSAASGWTLVSQQFIFSFFSSTVWIRVADGTEPSTWTPALGGSPGTTAWQTTVDRFSGVDNAAPINVQNSASQTSSNASTVAASLTTTVADCLLLFVGCSNNGFRTNTPPSGMSEQWDYNYQNIYGNSVTLATEQLGAAGATGSRTGTLSAASQNTTHMMALAPAVTPSGTSGPLLSNRLLSRGRIFGGSIFR